MRKRMLQIQSAPPDKIVYWNKCVPKKEHFESPNLHLLKLLIHLLALAILFTVIESANANISKIGDTNVIYILIRSI